MKPRIVSVLLVVFIAVIAAASGVVVIQENDQPVSLSGICGDCPGNCNDTCAAARASCLAQGGSSSSCETKYQNCLAWCNN
jgi:hypothetical protein